MTAAVMMVAATRAAATAVVVVVMAAMEGVAMEKVATAVFWAARRCY
jgi:hypothetical protein